MYGKYHVYYFYVNTCKFDIDLLVKYQKETNVYINVWIIYRHMNFDNYWCVQWQPYNLPCTGRHTLLSIMTTL
jgi:hypothetical protein